MRELIPVDLREPFQEALADLVRELVESVEQVFLAVRDGARSTHGRGS